MSVTFEESVPRGEMVVKRVRDFHVHLRQQELLDSLTVPRLYSSGVSSVIVMPNTIPPITTPEMALEYHDRLKSLEPRIDYLMTLYMTTKLTELDIKQCKQNHVYGVKMYPRGVTTNSDHGILIEELLSMHSVLLSMETEGITLNLHGESCDGPDVCVMTAEETFLPTVVKLHERYPRLKIVLEHVTTSNSVQLVKKLGSTVACTITAHHLSLIVDDWAGRPHNYCKPVAKYPADRKALQDVVREGHPRFFFGSDSAPHLRVNKECANGSAGVYTGAYILPYLVHILQSIGALDRLESFACDFGSQFYGLASSPNSTVKLVKQSWTIPRELPVLNSEGNEIGSVVPFMAGASLSWKIWNDE